MRDHDADPGPGPDPAHLGVSLGATGILVSDVRGQRAAAGGDDLRQGRAKLPLAHAGPGS